MRAKRLYFNRYLLDLERGCLLRDENEIVLRPKTFSVLRYLIENPHRLVSKDELFAAVWPNVVVTDDTLVQSISELRQAIGDSGASLIRTVPRRGYRFEADVTDASPAMIFSEQAQPKSPATPPAQAAGPDVFYTVPATSKRWQLTNGVLPASALLLVILIAGALWFMILHPWQLFGNSERLRADSAGSEMTERPAIAILPFLNQGNDSAREYFSEGVTQDLITALGRFSELTVMSWNAVSPYRHASATPGEIARRLAVQYQVEGSVLQTGDRVRVAVQLVNSDGRVLWSARFDEPIQFCCPAGQDRGAGGWCACYSRDGDRTAPGAC